MREIKCDVCGKKIFDEDNMTTIYFEFTDNNFHCDLERKQEKIVFECCHECAYEFNDFDMCEVACLLSSKISKAKKLKQSNSPARR